MAALNIEKVSNESLYVSEPPPAWFGNPSNPGNDKTWTNENWLKSRFHFSFAEYHSTERSNIGCLRVLNDDLVQPNRGFGEHPHSNMEIVTYVVEGSLTHQDSMGTAETLKAGSIQFMTAGTGVRHSEFNKDKTNPLRFLQIWINPRQRNLKPNYGSLNETKSLQERPRNQLIHMVTDSTVDDVETPVKINQDVNMYATLLDSEKAVTYNIGSDRQVYLVCVDGTVQLSGGQTAEETLSRHDAARLKGSEVTITGKSKDSIAHVFFIEMKQD